MGKFRVVITKVANQDIEKHRKSGNKNSIKNIAKILIDLSENPYEGFGNPEPLKYEYSGFWSRRINQKDRIVYRVEDDIVTVYVVSAMGHYSDK
ncbi:MAG: Txe/YoeB family addiction module toxin [Flavobacterium sp.]|nr:Txe/YoeB family addiction module toxin [Flavobacterium sp.]